MKNHQRQGFFVSSHFIYKHSVKEVNSNTMGGERVDRVYSDCLDDVCQVTCSLCGNRSTRPQFNTHWQAQHRESNEKNSSFVYSKLVYHKCKLCCEDILHDVVQIQEHITRRHKLETSLIVYKEQFLTGDFPGAKRKLESQQGNKNVNSNAVKKHKLNEVRKIGKSEVKQYVNEEDKKYEGEWESLDLEETDYETSDVHKMCLARCTLCQKITLLHHIQVIRMQTSSRKKKFLSEVYIFSNPVNEKKSWSSMIKNI